jgi:hypothetical protein
VRVVDTRLGSDSEHKSSLITDTRTMNIRRSVSTR